MIGQYTIGMSESNQSVQCQLLCLLYTHSHSLSLFTLVRLCNTIMFGMGPTDDPLDGISLDEVVSKENPLAISNISVDEK